MIEETWRGLKNARHAVIISSDLIVPAFQLAYAGIIYEAAHKKVQPAIFVIVEPNCAGRPSRSGQASLIGDIGEGPIVIVPVKNASSVGGDE